MHTMVDELSRKADELWSREAIEEAIEELEAQYGALGENEQHLADDLIYDLNKRLEAFSG
jgi:hypothetical protein